jgi:hypothetical protein
MLYHQKVINRSTPIGVQHVCFHRFGMVLTNCEGIRQNPVVTREFALVSAIAVLASLIAW